MDINTRTNNNPIGFFDSGVGGLSVYSVFKEKMSAENTIYFGDLKNMPYGNKSKNELIGFARKILNFMQSKNVKAVVIACNTSSANVYDIIKNDYNFKIYPIIQSCAKVIAESQVKNIGVFATEATVNSGAYEREIKKYNPDMNVISIPCPKWTNFVENDKINTEECLSDIKLKVEEIMKYNPQKIVLGCTHYPYLLQNLEKYAPKSLFIDPAEIFTDFIKQDLSKEGLINTSSERGYEEFYVSANPEDFKRNAALFYKIEKLPQIVS